MLTAGENAISPSQRECLATGASAFAGMTRLCIQTLAARHLKEKQLV